MVVNLLPAGLHRSVSGISEVVPRTFYYTPAAYHGIRIRVKIIPASLNLCPAGCGCSGIVQIIPASVLFLPAGLHDTIPGISHVIPFIIHINPAGCHLTVIQHIIPASVNLSPAGGCGSVHIIVIPFIIQHLPAGRIAQVTGIIKPVPVAIDLQPLILRITGTIYVVIPVSGSVLSPYTGCLHIGAVCVCSRCNHLCIIHKAEVHIYIAVYTLNPCGTATLPDVPLNRGIIDTVVPGNPAFNITGSVQINIIICPILIAVYHRSITCLADFITECLTKLCNLPLCHRTALGLIFQINYHRIRNQMSL